MRWIRIALVPLTGSPLPLQYTCGRRQEGLHNTFVAEGGSPTVENMSLWRNTGLPITDLHYA